MSECYKIVVETRKSPAGGLYQDVYRIEVTHELEDVEIPAFLYPNDLMSANYYIKAQRCRKCKQLFLNEQESDEDNTSLCQEIERLRELVGMQKEYINFLQAQPMSGWTHIEMGEATELRTKIAKLEESNGQG